MKKRKKTLIILLVVVIAVVGIGGGFYLSARNKMKAANTVSDLAVVKVGRGDIILSVSSTGVLEPYERYDIIPLVRGNIMSAPYEEGDMVNKDDVLYKIDDSDMLITLDRTRNSIDKKLVSNRQNAENIANLVIYAKEDGKISGLDVKVGDNVQNAKLGNIINDSVLKVTIPFTKGQTDNMYVGQNASVVSAEYMSYIDATVSDISSQPTPSGNGVFYMVEFTVPNPGSLTKGTTVTAVVDDMISASGGMLENASEITITAEASGKVKDIFVSNGDFVTKGTKLIQLENESYEITADTNILDMRDLELSLESQQKQLDDYYIKTPISGTVVEKNYKAGDTVNITGSSVILMTVADLSKLKFTMNIDELDISKLEIGQDVVVTADAVENETFQGKITKIATEGTSQNGVATYKVEVVIDQPGTLRPSMNVDAQIIIQSRTNVVRVSASDITKMGDKSFVTVKSDTSKTSENPTPNRDTDTDKDAGDNVNGSQGQRGSGTSGRRTSSAGTGNSFAPNGYELKEVVVGVSNNSYVEILEGLNEGDEILSLGRAVDPDDQNTGFPMMGGGFPMMGGGSTPIGGGGAPMGGGSQGGMRR